MEKTIEEKVDEEGRFIDINKVNDDYNEYPKKEEYQKLNFVDIEERGVFAE